MVVRKTAVRARVWIGAAIALFFGFTAFFALSQAREGALLKSHLTLYVGQPLISRGGTVIIGSVPIPVDEWYSLSGLNPADEDETNLKHKEINEADRLFGAFVYGPVSYVEMYYPEGGTFSFNFVPDYRLEGVRPVVTERILVGSGGWFDRENDVQRDWPDVSTIHVDGSSADIGNSRLVRAYGNNILNLGPKRQNFAGAIVYSPSNDQILEGTFGEYK